MGKSRPFKKSTPLLDINRLSNNVVQARRLTLPKIAGLDYIE